MAERFDERPSIQVPAKVGAEWKVVRLVHFGVRGGIEREFLSGLLTGEGAEQQVVQLITTNDPMRFPHEFAIAVDENGQSGVLCEYYGGYGSGCTIRLTRFTIEKPLYTGTDPERFIDGLYEADLKRGEAGLRRDGIGRRIASNKIIETEFRMRGRNGEALPLSVRTSTEMSLSLGPKSVAIALRISHLGERGDDALTAVFDRATKKWIPTTALSVKPN